MMYAGAATGLRHDLFTLFNHVVGYCELLLEEPDDAVSDGVRRHLLAMSRAGREAIAALKAVLSEESLAGGPVDRLSLVGALEGPLNTIERRSGELLAAALASGPQEIVADLERIQRAGERARALAYHEPLPQVPQAGPEAEAPRVSQARLTIEAHDGLVLIVDDDADTRELLARRLVRLGYRTLFASNGAEALEILASEPVDLVLLDLQMPVLDGFAVLAQRRDDERLRDIPFVMISSLDDVGSVVRCIEMGAEDYLPKPFDPVLLQARLGACLERKRLRDRERELMSELADWNSMLEARAREQAEEMARLSRLRRFLSPQLADAVVSAGADAVLATHRRQIAVVFCDLRGFTRFAEVAEPEDIMAVLRDFHDAMGRLIHDFGATVGYFAGDGLMVFFNDPVPCPDPAPRAVRMAVAMRDDMVEMAAEWKRRGHDLGFGVGVSYGYATLGEIGFEDRFDYGVIGNVVNLAARLCDRARSGEILISQRAQREVDGVAETEDRGLLSLPGFHDPVPVFAVVTLADQA